jgi:hypothetical protein
MLIADIRDPLPGEEGFKGFCLFAHAQEELGRGRFSRDAAEEPGFEDVAPTPSTPTGTFPTPTNTSSP